MNRKIFGTDGVRGKANIYPVTPDIALNLGKSAVIHFKKDSFITKGRHKIVVGKDTRKSSYMLEAAIASGICSAGADAVLLGPLPTPGISFITRSMRADAGIVISASHNPFFDNGIKFFNNKGKKLFDEEEFLLEETALEPEKINFEIVDDGVGKIYRVEDAQGRYVEFLKSAFPKNMGLDGLKISLDCANGATYKVAPTVFSELGAELFVYSKTPDGTNINHNCGALYPEFIAKKVVENKTDIGIALDGDGDRVILIDENGKIIDGDKLIGMAAIALKNKGLLKNNSVVTTIMSNAGLENFLNKNNIRMYRSNVGDRYVYQKMIKTGSILGGENSGHIIFSEFNPTGDGIVSALQILAIMKENNVKLSKLASEIELFPQISEKIRVNEKRPLETMSKLTDLISKFNENPTEKRVVVRYSGTEPVLRFMAEAKQKTEAEEMIETLKITAIKYLK